MSLAVLRSRALTGVEAPPVAVEIHIANGLPAFNIVGLADTEVRESRERVRAALLNSAYEFPARRITVNLAPADLPKESGRFDLAIALGILVASGQLPGDGLDAFEFAGELSLAGDLRPVRGALVMAMGLARDNARRTAQGQPARAFIVADGNGPEAALVDGLTVHAGATLRDVRDHLGLPPRPAPAARRAAGAGGVAGWRGPYRPGHARRARPVAGAACDGDRGRRPAFRPAGGPPGTGKSMLAQRFAGLLPPMTPAGGARSRRRAEPDAGRLPAGALGPPPVPQPAPHGQRRRRWSAAAAIRVPGRSRWPITACCFSTNCQSSSAAYSKSCASRWRPATSPHLARGAASRTSPRASSSSAAMNPCPCGYLGHPLAAVPLHAGPDPALSVDACSGPLLDRVDLQIEVPAQSQQEILRWPARRGQRSVRARAAAARARQLGRQGMPNGELSGRAIDDHCPLGGRRAGLAARGDAKLGWSARAYFRVLKVARTIADLEDARRC